MRKTLFATTFAALATLGLCAAWLAEEVNDQQLGTVHFATSCNEMAQRRFDRAMRYQHSFWYAESRDIYQEALKADPQCAIAYWGIALSLLNNPHSPVPAPNLPLGLAAIEKAKATGAKTQRERDYIDALAVMYVDFDKTSHQARVQSYLKAMEALAAKYPDDDEAQIFYAITLNVAASPADKTYANQLKGAAILEPIFQRQPRHPGVAHYLIHLYDYPAIAAKASGGATLFEDCAGCAACAAHAFPHFYPRRLLEGVDRGQLGFGAGRESREELGDQLHGAGLSGLRLSAAWRGQAGAQRGRRNRGGPVDRRCLRRRFCAGRFAGALHDGTRRLGGRGQLEVRPSKFPHVMAVTYFARAIGAARSGTSAAAKADAAKLAEIRDKLREAKNAYWAGQVDVQRRRRMPGSSTPTANMMTRSRR